MKNNYLKLTSLVIFLISFTMIVFTTNSIVKANDSTTTKTVTVEKAKDTANATVTTKTETSTTVSEPTVLDYILGDYSANELIAMYIFALIGITLSLLLGTTTRNVKSTATPEKFDWVFMFKDNWIRITTSILVIYATFRFAFQIIGIEITQENCTWIAFCVGFGLDLITGLIKSKTNIFNVSRSVVASTPTTNTPDTPTTPNAN